ncbi:deoxycytidyl transferase [Ascochyta rabiei]|uniref:deoxycytidyl transferase n=1 Tax=Didymella rabiei TaxID=5454 RepID=UPI00190028A0|nr:deoxycytidyl transferase [Ascochyta rabiei]UPX10355.1 deoxycytidyl transferase [Ascochyta rabiei]
MDSRLEKKLDSVRKRIAAHTFDGEDGEEYGGSAFGGFTDYFRRKRIKLQNLDAATRAQAGDKPRLFRGLVAHVNGYTQPSLNDLHTLIVQHGGGFLQYLDGKTAVTHIIASSLTPKKVVEFRQYRIVKPAWVVDSIAAGKLLPWNHYRVVDEGETQKVLAFDKGSVVSTANSKQRGYRDQTDNSWYTGQLRASQTTPPAALQATNRSRFARQKLPTPDDDADEIEDLPPSHQPEESSSSQVRKAKEQGKTLVSPPKTSPTIAPEPSPDEFGNIDDIADELHDSLYADPTPARPLPRKKRQSTPPQDRIHAAEIAANPRKTELTAEEHNAILLRDPRIRKSTVVDPNFLEQYYRESRLHHLSTWKADLKAQLQAMASEKTATQKAKQKRPPGARRYILHVDFDSFFAAVSLKKSPEYENKPAVVAHGQGSGSEIASCNYPARKYGVKNGMWMKRAMELCPDLKILPYDFPAYEEASRAFYDAILATGGLVQSVSIDEALIDVSNICGAIGGSDGRKMNEAAVYREQAKADEIAKSLREQIKLRTECDVSVGIGGNILLAKVALRKAKPAGQHQIQPQEVLDFLGQLQVQDLPGVAWSIGGKLEDAGVKLVKDLRDLTKERLIQILGPKTGEKLYEYARGIDKQEVGEQVIRKSVSAEVNWGVRFATQEQAEEFITSLCNELQKRLLKEKVKGKQFTMKIMRRAADAPIEPPKHLGHGKCDTFNKSLVMGVATNSKEVLTKEAIGILRGFGFSPGELRGIGVQVTKLEPMKSATDGSLDGSQRRLQFKMPTKPLSARKGPASSIIETPVSARKIHVNVPPEPASVRNEPETVHEDVVEEPTSIFEELREAADVYDSSLPFTAPVPTPTSIRKAAPSPFVEADPIQDDPETPRKSKTPAAADDHVAFGAAQLNQSTPSRRPLNMMGTQFILPTQVDPKVLAELPPDIRSKLLRQRQSSPTPAARRDDSPGAYVPSSPSTPSSKMPFAATALPAQSQLDPEILAALPDDVRAEIMLHYSAAGLTQFSPSRRPRGVDQTILPQSPRKNRIIGIPAKKPLQIKRGRGRPPRSAMLAAAAQMKAVSKDGKTLTQANFISLKNPVRQRSEEAAAADAPSRKDDADLDPEFLQALPEDVRKEVIAEHKATKLRAFRLALQRPRPGTSKPPTHLPHLPHHQHHHQQTCARPKTIQVPRPQTASFTREKLHAEPDLRDAMRDWVGEFRAEGPYPEDVAALSKYLSKVVGEERDLRKAVGVVKWLDFMVGDVDAEAVEGEGAEGTERWEDAVERVKAGVCRAARARGLGRVRFE